MNFLNFKNPIIIGVIVFLIVYAYMCYSEYTKSKEAGTEMQYPSLIPGLLCGIVAWFLCGSFFDQSTVTEALEGGAQISHKEIIESCKLLGENDINKDAQDILLDIAKF